MSYLDDADHLWEIDPACRNEQMSLKELMQQIQERDWEGLDIILDGYAGLRNLLLHATREECLSTSIVWYFG